MHYVISLFTYGAIPLLQVNYLLIVRNIHILCMSYPNHFRAVLNPARMGIKYKFIIQTGFCYFYHFKPVFMCHEYQGHIDLRHSDYINFGIRTLTWLDNKQEHQRPLRCRMSLASLRPNSHDFDLILYCIILYRINHQPYTRFMLYSVLFI